MVVITVSVFMISFSLLETVDIYVSVKVEMKS